MALRERERTFPSKRGKFLWISPAELDISNDYYKTSSANSHVGVSFGRFRTQKNYVAQSALFSVLFKEVLWSLSLGLTRKSSRWIKLCRECRGHSLRLQQCTRRRIQISSFMPSSILPGCQQWLLLEQIISTFQRESS